MRMYDIIHKKRDGFPLTVKRSALWSRAVPMVPFRIISFRP